MIGTKPYKEDYQYNKFGFTGMVTQLEGQMLEDYAYLVARTTAHPRFIEIGSYGGSSTAYICNAIRKSKTEQFTFHAIDTFMASNPELDGRDTLDLFKENLHGCMLSTFVVPIRSSSMDAVDNYDDNMMHFIFIDGSHELEDVINDIKGWLEKLSVGSLMAVHDTLMFDGVRYGLLQFEDQLELIAAVDSLKIFRKIK